LAKPNVPACSGRQRAVLHHGNSWVGRAGGAVLTMARPKSKLLQKAAAQ